MMTELRSYKHLAGLEMSLGGQMGISISPVGWDKSYVQKVINLNLYDEIFFFGDKMGIGGSDAAVKKVSKIKCIPVQNPDHTHFFLKQFKNKDYQKLALSWVIESSDEEASEELVESEKSGDNLSLQYLEVPNPDTIKKNKRKSRRNSDLGIIPKCLSDDE